MSDQNWPAAEPPDDEPSGDDPQGDRPGPDDPDLSPGEPHGEGGRRGASPFDAFLMGGLAGGAFGGGGPRGPRAPGGSGPGGSGPGGSGAGGSGGPGAGGPGAGGAGGARAFGVRRRRSPLIPVLLILGALVGLIVLGSSLWTELLWYDSVGARRVLLTEWISRAVLFAGAGLIAGLAVWVAAHFAFRHRPLVVPMTEAQRAMDHYRSVIEPMRRTAFVVGPLLIAGMAGLAAASQWQTALLWWNRQPFGIKDPHFGLDIGFFVFTMPWVSFLLELATVVLTLALIVSAFTHYVYGGISLAPKGLSTTHAARVQLALWAAGVVAVRGIAYWFSRYEQAIAESDRITGITYTDAHALVPAKAILALACVVCVALFIATIWTRTWRLPIIAVALLAVCALAIGGAYPALVQSLKVKPSEVVLEAPYIQRNIDSTLAAYGLDNVAKQRYSGKTEATPAELRTAARNMPGIRIVDPAVVPQTFKELESSRGFYAFPDSLDVDRYTFDDETHDTVIGVRELSLDGLDPGQRNWINDHMIYTHGFGLVAAHGNQRDEDGRPRFFQRGIPPQGPLDEFEPRIYFGERSPLYSIVGAPEGAPQREFDYPTSEGEGTTGQAQTSYAGEGGVAIDNWLRKAAYAVKYRELKILLSSDITDESRMLDHRTPLERVARVAPWLHLDGNPYPAVVDGRVLWIVDGYTTSSSYPYSQLSSLSDVTQDALSATRSSVKTVGGGQVNYIRNSVKATVDAYDGHVTLYAWDDQDPVLKAWSAAFPTSITPMSEIDGDLMSHLRYPEGLFKVQRDILGRYHVNSARDFFSGGDFWRVPDDPSRANTKQPAYYISVQMPQTDAPSFSLTTPFVPAGGERSNLVGYLAVDADAGSEKGTKRGGYGTLRLLEMDRASTVPGPGQVQNNVKSAATYSAQFGTTLAAWINLNDSQNSQVQFANQLTLPFAGGLLYVQPVYVQASSGASYPLQKAVVVAFGEKVAWGMTVDAALDSLFEVAAQDPGQSDPGDPTSPPPTSPPPTSPPPTSAPPTSPTAEPTGPTPPTTPDPAALTQALEDAKSAYAEGERALKDGDWEAYGASQDKLRDAIDRAIAASPEGGAIDFGQATADPSAEPTGEATTEGSASPTS